MMFSDEKGSLELIEKDGKKSLRATDPNGKVLFDGPINTENERKSIPSLIAERLKKMEKKCPLIDTFLHIRRILYLSFLNTDVYDILC